MDAFEYPTSIALREVALALPEVSEGTSCVNRAFKVRKKNFLFLGEKEGTIRIMVKLVDSYDDAAGRDDPRVSAGSAGWVTLRFSPDDPLDDELLAAWTCESFRALAPKTVLKAMVANSRA